MFRNFYQCPDCKENWEDTWSSTSNDRCPNCGLKDIEPYESKDEEKEDAYTHH